MLSHMVSTVARWHGNSAIYEPHPSRTVQVAQSQLVNLARYEARSPMASEKMEALANALVREGIRPRDLGKAVREADEWAPRGDKAFATLMKKVGPGTKYDWTEQDVYCQHTAKGPRRFTSRWAGGSLTQRLTAEGSDSGA